jgi:EmrB/QacA subfamily drug resistance transporter
MTATALPTVLPSESASRSRWTLIAVCVGTFMLLVDVTIVQVALPTIQEHLHASFSDLQWVIDAYALALAALILTWGSISDRFGRKRVFVAGLAVFTGSSLLCGLAQSITTLIWARALQGVGGAAMFATGLALIAQDFQGPARGKAIAAWGATVGGAVAVGPLVGGALTSGIGWRWIFIVNVPIGVAAIWLSSTKMRNQTDPGATRLDVLGLVSFAGAMFLLELGLIRGDSLGWSSTSIVAMFAGSAAAFATFIIVELRQARPMFDLSLFRKPGFIGVSISTFAIGGGMFALLPYLTLYFQNDLGYSPFAGGLRLLPLTVLTFVVPFVFRRPAQKFPPGVVLGAGIAITAGGIAALLAVGPNSGWTALIPGLMLSGFGVGIANPAIARVGLGVVPPERSGMASGISNTFRTAGLATGVAALGAIFQQRITTSLTATAGAHAAALGRVVSSAGVKAAAHGQSKTADAARIAFVSGLHTILLIAAVAVAVGALAAVLVRSKDFHRPAAPVPPTAPAPPVDDGHLRSNEFLAMDQFPEITFTSTAAQQVSQNEFKLTGNLTVKGVTNLVTIDFEYQGSAKDPYGNRRAGFEGKTTINRKDFGVTTNLALETGGVLVGDKVILELDVSLIRS